MAKVKNYHVYGSVAFVNGLKEDYDWLGRYAKIVEPGHLVVFALPPKKVKKDKSDEDKRRNSNREDEGRSDVRPRSHQRNSR